MSGSSADAAETPQPPASQRPESSLPAGLRRASKRSGLAPVRIENEPGFLLHAYAYRETSLMLEVFTRTYGRVALIAKGAKRPYSALRGVLLTFEPLALGWTGRGDVKILSRADWVAAPQALAGMPALCGYYLNELLMGLLARGDPHERLFDHYAAALRGLSAVAQSSTNPPNSGAAEHLSALLRLFEWKLIQAIGYGFDVSRDTEGALIDEAHSYWLQPGQGITRSQQRTAPAFYDDLAARPVSVAALRLLADFDDSTQQSPIDAVAASIGPLLASQPTAARALRLLLRDLLTQHLDGRQLRTREVWRALQVLDANLMPSANAPTAEPMMAL